MQTSTTDLGPGVRRRRRFDNDPDDRSTADDVRRNHPADRGTALLHGIGWVGIGLGLTQIIAPRVVQRLIGAPEGNTFAMRTMGLRELVSGIGILSGRKAETFVGGRVLGDALDLSMLLAMARSPNASPGRLAAAAVAVLGVTALDVMAQRRLKNGIIDAEALRTTTLSKAVTIGKSPDEVYSFYRELSNLPRFMEDLESVERLSVNRYHFKARGPAGTTLEWDAEIVDDQPGKLLAWRSIEGMSMKSRGQARFLPAPGGRGTELVVTVTAEPPGGETGANVMSAANVLFGGLPPAMQLVSDLRRLKQLLELGEIMKSDASIHKGRHPAVPASASEKAALAEKEGGR